MRKFLLNATSTLLAAQLNAGLLNITYQNGTGIFSSAATGQPVLNSIADAVNQYLPSAGDQNDFLKGMANANSIAAAGVATTYSTVFKYFLLGASVSGGVDLGSKSIGEIGDITNHPEEFAGFGLQPAILLGVNAGNLFGMSDGFKRLNLYLSGLTLNHSFSDVAVKYTGLGFGAQYRLIEDRSASSRSVRWTGLDIGTGFLYSRMDIDADINLNKTYNVTYSGQPITATTSNTEAFIKANVNTFTVPFEVSTALRLFRFLKLVGGAGMDLNFGKTSGQGYLSPDSTFTASDSSGINTINGNASLNVDGSANPDLINLRVFAGPHIEFGVGSFFATINKSVTQNTVAMNTGLDFFW